jgi:hypothetical protein
MASTAFLQPDKNKRAAKPKRMDFFIVFFIFRMWIARI